MCVRVCAAHTFATRHEHSSRSEYAIFPYNATGTQIMNCSVLSLTDAVAQIRVPVEGVKGGGGADREVENPFAMENCVGILL